MSDPNHEIQLPDMEATSTTPPSGHDSEFVVHTKHTCDACFQQPIIGKRYTSGIHSNFDLCARCFESYSGSDISLSEVALLRDKKLSSDFALKLKIEKGGNIQVRRINVAEIWGKSTAQLSFEKMMSIASGFAENKIEDAAALDAFTAKANVTYIDEDGDKITISSNKELEDSFLQILKAPQPFRITVSLSEDESSKGAAAPAGIGKGLAKRNQNRKIQPETTLRVTPQKFEKVFFIHARHTCDGCSKSPIIGTRYHATKIPDFDLCRECFEKYEGEDLDFKPEIHDRDRRMQQKWLKKQLSNSLQMPTKIAGTWNKTNGDISDFLKKVQESGGVIESATVFSTRPCEESKPCSEPKSDVSPEKTTEDAIDSPGGEEPVTPETIAVDIRSPTHGSKKTHVSSNSSKEESFLSDADGNGSIAEAIGRTLDVCVQAIEEAMDDEMKEINKTSTASVEDDVAVAAAVSADAFSVASSMVSSMSDILKKLDEPNKFGGDSGSHAVMSQPKGADNVESTLPSATADGSILGTEKGNGAEVVKAEDVSEGEEDWSVIGDEFGHKSIVGTEAEVTKEEDNTDKSVTSVEPLSPVVLAKWDTELVQLHELGFLNDRMNVDVLERLEASHVAVNSSEQVTVQSAVEQMLIDLA